MKMVEQEELYLFLDAYKVSLGRRLRIRLSGERPDFICARGNNRLVGVELTKVMRDPAAVIRGRIEDVREFARPNEIVEEIHWAIEKKEQKRRTGEWACRDSTVLVLQVMDCPLSDLAPFLEGLGPSEFGPHGFAEIFIADHTELAAYGAVELFGLWPRRLWGYFERDRGKPYG